MLVKPPLPPVEEDSLTPVPAIETEVLENDSPEPSPQLKKAESKPNVQLLSDQTLMGDDAEANISVD